MSENKKVVSWLLEVGRPVLGHLVSATLMRHLDQFLGIALFVIGVGAVANAVRPGGPQWLPDGTLQLAICLIVIALLKALARYLEMFWCHLVAFKALELLRVRLYRGLVPQASTIGTVSTSGDLLTRATRDIDRIEVFFAHTFPPAVTAITVPILGVLGLGFWADWRPALAAAIGLALSVFVVPLLGSKRLLTSAATQGEIRGKISAHVTDTVQGMSEVTGYGHVAERLDQLSLLDEEANAGAKPRVRQLAARQCASTFVMLATLLTVTECGLSAELEIATLAICVAVVWRLFDATEAVRDFADSLDTSLACANRVYKIVHAQGIKAPEYPKHLPAGPLGVRVDSLSYRYPTVGSGRKALSDVSVNIAPSSHVALIGASGCGKSTLLKLIGRLAEPDSGVIEIGGVDLTSLSEDELRSRVCLVAQSPMLFNGTVADNLLLVAPDATPEKLTEVMQIAQIGEELSLDSRIGPQGKQISGGQAQRLSLAMALLVDADVYLLDEYTSHLNTQLAAEVRRTLRLRRPKATIIEATHTAAGLSDVDAVIVLETKVLAAGKPAELSQAGPLAELIARQADAL